MKQKDLHKIRRSMEKTLDVKRFEHTLGVSYTAAALAMCHNVDVKQAKLAGMLHDCAKCMDNDKKVKICEKNSIEISAVEQENPFLLHAKVGRHLAQTKYGVEDLDVLQAILYHTTGRPEMSKLEKIIYIADYIEPGRKPLPNLPIIRKLAFVDLDAALVQILENTLTYLKSCAGTIDPMTQKTYEYYKKEQEKT